MVGRDRPVKRGRPDELFFPEPDKAGSYLRIALSSGNSFRSKGWPWIQAGVRGILGAVEKLDKANFLADGCLLVKTKTQKQTERFLKATIFGDEQCEVVRDAKLNQSRGTINAYDLIDLSETEIVGWLEEYGVVGAKRFTKKLNGKVENTPTLLLTFNQPTCPQKLQLDYVTYHVHQYVPNPLMCYRCGLFGHSEAKCTREARCLRCGKPKHDGECEMKCLNCEKPGHTCLSRECDAWKKEKEICRIKTEQDISYPQARKVYETNYDKPRSSPQTYATAIRTPSVMSKKEAELTDKVNKLESKMSEMIELLKQLVPKEILQGNAVIEGCQTLCHADCAAFIMKYSICMVSDFFYPNSGGVEAHVFQLSQCLLAMGHKVIVVTHSYGSRVGIRYMTSGLKVYYCPYKTFYKGCVLPTMLTTLPLLRNIFIREQVDIVHGHSAFSTLAHEAMLHAGSMGIRTVFTDHSLFGFADTSAIVTNNFLQVSLAQVDHCICVSYTGKENTVLRANVTSHRVSVIPNAVDSAAFTPEPSRRSSDRITVVMVSRLVYRKGADLLAGLIPLACRKHDKLHFLIGGDGPKRSMLEEMTEKNQLSDRVTFLGELKHSEVRDVLVQGDIYINCSLTEAFCIAIVEAASCGLQVVSTRVGGVPEVLPPDQIWLTEPTVESLLSGLDAAVAEAGRPSALSAWDRHRRVASMYRWQEVAARTQDVYDIVWRTPRRDQRSQTMRYLSSGPLSGKFMIAVLFLLRLYSAFLEWFQPREDIELAADWQRGFRSANQPLQH